MEIKGEFKRIKKMCRRCENTLPLEEFFGRNRLSKDGYNQYCKDCAKTMAKESYEKNKAIRLKQLKKYNKENEEDLKEYRKKYYTAKKEKMHQYYLDNKEKINTRSKNRAKAIHKELNELRGLKKELTNKGVKHKD
jgi:hypothetical protein